MASSYWQWGFSAGLAANLQEPPEVPVEGSHSSQAPLIQSHLPQEPTCPGGPRGHKSDEAFLLKDDTAADEQAGEEGEGHADVEAIPLPDPLLPGDYGGIAGFFRAEASDDLTEDLLGRAVETDYGT